MMKLQEQIRKLLDEAKERNDQPSSYSHDFAMEPLIDAVRLLADSMPEAGGFTRREFEALTLHLAQTAGPLDAVCVDMGVSRDSITQKLCAAYSRLLSAKGGE